MKLRRSPKRGFLETASASDLAFLLIIYFIVIAGFNITAGFLFQPPTGDSAEILSDANLIRFEMDRSGSILYEERLIDIFEAKNLLRTFKEKNSGAAALIIVDGQAKWQNIVSFVEMAHDLEIEYFSFAMKSEIP